MLKSYAIEKTNEVLGTDFSNIDPGDVSLDEAQELVPLIEPYNNLVTSAKKFDENDPASVDSIYMDAYFLSSSVVVMKGKFAYKVAFKKETNFIKQRKVPAVRAPT